MQGKFVNYLYELSTDPKAAQRLKGNPDETMRAAGLSDEQISALKSKDQERIKRAVMAESPLAAEAFGIEITLVLKVVL